MKMMKAIVKKSVSDTTFSMKSVPVPQIEQDEMLVRMSAIGVGIHDGYFLPTDMEYPYTLGIEGAGVVEQTGSEIVDLSVGDRIAFVSMMQEKGGTWAEYAVVSKDSLILKLPDKMNFTTAAAIPVAGNTILKAFRELPLKHGDSLFIAGASGAIGTFAIQLAKKRGLQIASSASLKNHDYMRSLGADFTVDYNDSDWQEKVKAWKPEGVDAAIAIQPNTGMQSMEIVKNKGIVVPISDFQLHGERDISVRLPSHNQDVSNELTMMMEQILNDEITLTIEHVYPFDKSLDALHKATTRHARGKLVIDLESTR